MGRAQERRGLLGYEVKWEIRMENELVIATGYKPRLETESLPRQRSRLDLSC